MLDAAYPSSLIDGAGHPVLEGVTKQLEHIQKRTLACAVRPNERAYALRAPLNVTERSVVPYFELEWHPVTSVPNRA